MKRVIWQYFAYSLLVFSFAFSMPNTPPSLEIRYDLDFRIKEWTSPDFTILAGMNVDQYESMRQDTSDIEITDPSTTLTIVLFSKYKAIENEAKSKVQLHYFRDLYFKEIGPVNSHHK